MSFEPPSNYDAYLQEQLARWAVEDVDESETPEEEIARREKRARITQAAVNRYLIGFAVHGTCGDPIRSEPGNVDIALTYAEEAEADDLAVAEPLRDLHWILKNGTSEECAQGVGAAWRSQHPFRPTRSGDPYEMLVPQNDRVRAMIAVDQARALPSPVGTAIQEHGAVVKRALARKHNKAACNPPMAFAEGVGQHSAGRLFPCTRTTALNVLLDARQVLNDATSSFGRRGQEFYHQMHVLLDKADMWLADESVDEETRNALNYLSEDASRARSELTSVATSEDEFVAGDRVEAALSYVNAYAHGIAMREKKAL